MILKNEARVVVVLCQGEGLREEHAQHFEWGDLRVERKLPRGSILAALHQLHSTQTNTTMTENGPDRNQS